MTAKTEGQIQEFGGRVEEYAGKKVRNKVMEGSEAAARSSNKQKVAVWMKEAVDRLDACAGPEKCAQIMRDCGHTCIAHNQGLANGLKNRRLKYKTEADFLDAEMTQKPIKGIRLELQGKTLVQYYTPRAYAAYKRCLCSLMNALPEDMNASPTWCQCSAGFVEKYWEGALGRPVEVEVIETSLTGAEECKFVVHL